ncbi:DUF6034 family protein [Lachnospiraceae bacterium ZAX-1]
MRKKYVFLATITTLVLTASACQKTPEEPIVTNKKNDKLEEAILSSEAPTEGLNIETDWQEQFTSNDNNVTININAAVELPEVDEIPVVSCIPHYFTLEEVENAINLFYGNAALYDNSLSDQDWLETEIIKSKADLEYLKRNGKYPEEEGEDAQRAPVLNLDEEVAWLEDMIAQLEADYQAIPDQSSNIVEIEWKENEYGAESVNVRDAQIPPMQFYAFNYKSVNDAAMEYEVTGSDSSLSEPLGISEQLDIATSREEAEHKALEVAYSCGISECKVVSAGRMQIDGQLSYVFTLGRLVGGVPCVPVPNYEGTLSFGTDGKEYREPWKQENIQVMVNDKGVVGFLWEYPPEILNVLNENVAIMPYDKMKEIAKSRLQISQTADQFELSQNGGRTIEIDRIVLNMMRVAQKDSVDSYYYLPVWDFLGETVDVAAEISEGATEISEGVAPVSEKSFLTINAIDGSIVDRGLGY